MIHDKKFSLALGGGGARGIAHIGVIRFLEQQWLAPREISGTSMGALIGACYALWKTSEDMERVLSGLSYFSLLDFDLTRWFLKGKKIEKFLEELYEEKTFDDIHIPLSIIATDIHDGSMKVFRTGKLSKAVRASIAIPWIFMPYSLESTDYVDGGVLENLPITPLMPWDVLAVSCLPDISKKIEYGKKFFSRSFQKTLFANGYNILQKSLDIMLFENEKRTLASRDNIILVRPDFSGLGYYEFASYVKLIERGYSAAQKTLIYSFHWWINKGANYVTLVL